MKINESLINIKVKGKEVNLIKFFNPRTCQNYYLSVEEIERAIALKEEYINPYQPVRTLVQLNDGNWYCEETEKLYQLTEVKEM